MSECQPVINVIDAAPNIYLEVVDGGTGGGSADLLIEDLIGVINGSNATFTSTYEFVIASVGIYVNGLLQKKVTNWNNTGTQTIIFTDSPMVGDLLQISYIKL